MLIINLIDPEYISDSESNSENSSINSFQSENRKEITKFNKSNPMITNTNMISEEELERIIENGNESQQYSKEKKNITKINRKNILKKMT